MAIDRRRFLALGAALGLGHIPVAALAAEAERAAEAARTGGARYLSARKRGDRDETALLDESGRDLRVVPMPARGHSFAIDAPAGAPWSSPPAGLLRAGLRPGWRNRPR
ncbi:hypothetical protein WJ968_14170 [Achromobacter xylosoxidans]